MEIKIPVESYITEYLHNKACASLTPLNGTFELLPLCNMNCRMCYIRIGKEEQEAIHPLHTVEEWLELGRIARDKGMLYLLLTGGEPFMYPGFKEILQGMQKMGILVSVNTNGTLIDEDTIEWLKEAPPSRLNITLYGASDETYERLCMNPKGHTQVVNAIHLLKEAGISVKINCSITPYNVDDLEDIVKFCKEEELILEPTTYMFPPIRKDSSLIGQNDRFTPEDAAYYSMKVNMLMNGEESFREYMKNPDFNNWSISVPDECMDMEGECIKCRAGKASFWVTWKGDLYPCGMITDESAKNVFKDGFDASWKYATDFTNAIRLPYACSVCDKIKSCRACAAMVVTETGHYDMVPEYRCKMTHAIPEAAYRLLDEINNRK